MRASIDSSTGPSTKPWSRTQKEVNTVNMTEPSRLILGLRAAGWSEKEINDFILYIELGDEQYKPKART